MTDVNGKKYTDLIRNIRYAWLKVGKYPTYFDAFYPSPEIISEAECLTHHVHAYLDDLYTVKTKVFTLSLFDDKMIKKLGDDLVKILGKQK